MRRDRFVLRLGLVVALAELPHPAAAAGPQATSPAWPLDAPQVLTSSFGEYRANHLHAGIDLGTGGRTGVPCRAVGDGSVVRMRMSPFGYGKALYIQLEGGTLTVYAHLSRFAGPLASRARREQERLGRYTFDIQIPPGELPVRRGEIVAWSGQTGVGVPHLHYEMRQGDVAINPQTAGFPVRDSIPPVIEEIAATPLDPRSHVEGQWDTCSLLPRGPAAPPSRLGGRIGFSVRAWDAATSRGYRVGPYSCLLRVDGVVVYRSVQERFDYADNHLAVLEYDQARLLERGERVQLLYRRPGDRLPGRAAPGSGEGVLFAPAPADTAGERWFAPGVHTLEVEVADAAGNATVRRVQVEAGGTSDHESWPAAEPGRDGDGEGGLRLAGPPVWRSRFVELAVLAERPVEIEIRTPDSQGAATVVERVGPLRYRAGVEIGAAEGTVEIAVRGRPPAVQVRLPARAVRAGRAARLDDLDPALGIDIPAGALLEDVAVRVERQAIASGTLGNELFVAGPWLCCEPRTAALDAPVVITLRDSAAVPRARVGLFWVNRGGDLRLLAASRDASGALRGETRYLSYFGALADTTPPRLGPARLGGTERRPRIEFTVHDEGARLGDEGLAVTLDGQVAIAEWDPETGAVQIDLAAPLERGAHRLRVEATDQLGNRARRETRLQVP